MVLGGHRRLEVGGMVIGVIMVRRVPVVVMTTMMMMMLSIRAPTGLRVPLPGLFLLMGVFHGQN